MSGVNMVEAVDEADRLSDLTTLMYLATLGLAEHARAFSASPEVSEAMELGARQVRDSAARLKAMLAGEAIGDPAG